MRAAINKSSETRAMRWGSLFIGSSTVSKTHRFLVCGQHGAIHTFGDDISRGRIRSQNLARHALDVIDC